MRSTFTLVTGFTVLAAAAVVAVPSAPVGAADLSKRHDRDRDDDPSLINLDALFGGKVNRKDDDDSKKGTKAQPFGQTGGPGGLTAVQYGKYVGGGPGGQFYPPYVAAPPPPQPATPQPINIKNDVDVDVVLDMQEYKVDKLENGRGYKSDYDSGSDSEEKPKKKKAPKKILVKHV